MQEYNKASYVDTVTDQIRCKRARSLVAEEIAQHIDDQAEEYRKLGFKREEAEIEAVRQMGDPITVGNDLDRIHRPKMDVKLILLTAVLLLAGLMVQYIQAGGGDARWFIQQFLYTEIGIAVMVVICFLDYTILGKYPLQFWGGWTLFLLFGIVFRIFPEVNGQLRIYPLLILMIPLYAGFIYRFRGCGYRGLIICGAAAGLNLMICWMMPSRTAVTEHFLIYAAMLTWAVHKGWFAVAKSKGYLLIYLPIITLLTAAAANISRLASKGSYTFVRLDAALHPEKYADSWGYIGIRIREILSGIQLTGNAKDGVFQRFLAENPAIIISDVASDMMFTYILESYGILAGIILLVFLGCMITRIFASAFHQKNQLGAMVGLGCAGLFLTQTVFYVLYNLGCTFFSPMYLPFFSRSGSGIIAICILMGLVLSVYRNTNLVKEKTVKTLPRYRIRIEKIV